MCYELVDNTTTTATWTITKVHFWLKVYRKGATRSIKDSNYTQ